MLTTARLAERPSTPSVQLTTLMLAQIRTMIRMRSVSYTHLNTDGTIDFYMNCVVGLVHKYYGDDLLRDLFATWDGDLRESQLDLSLIHISFSPSTGMSFAPGKNTRAVWAVRCSGVT